MFWSYAQAGTNATSQSIATRYKRIGSKFDIQQTTLCAFGQNFLALRDTIVDEIFAIDNFMGFQKLDGAVEFGFFFGQVEIGESMKFNEF